MRIIVYIESCIIAYTARSDLMADDTESIFGFKLTGQNARPDMNLFNFKL